jgi:type IV pilus assembly protein PilE
MTSSANDIRRPSSGSAMNRGFTLIEVMIVVAIIAILASIAYPSYIEQMRKGYRKECSAGLAMAIQAQERYYANNNKYATTITDAYKDYSGDSTSAAASCGLAAAACDSAGTGIACIRITATTKKADPKCATMTLDSTNKRSALDNSSTDQTALCW